MQKLQIMFLNLLFLFIQQISKFPLVKLKKFIRTPQLNNLGGVDQTDAMSVSVYLIYISARFGLYVNYFVLRFQLYANNSGFVL